ncbi:hypothetical protein, partial [Herbaspirillum sp.]|uniref:hypothetical protein n=1 Tax=Herbaspirillum sp. TaxID=1890675 RepID=UPI00258CC4EE
SLWQFYGSTTVSCFPEWEFGRTPFPDIWHEKVLVPGLEPGSTRSAALACTARLQARMRRRRRRRRRRRGKNLSAAPTGSGLGAGTGNLCRKTPEGFSLHI